MHACSGLAYRGHQTAKRSVTRVRDLPAETKPELDLATQLEKQTFDWLQKVEVRQTI